MLQGPALESATSVNERPAVISVFDYGAGNLRSVENTLGAIGAPYKIVCDAASVQVAEKIILPGVGHFGQITRALDDMGVRGAFIERIQAGVPFFGICIGLQALFESSEEAPGEHGLGLFPGIVRRFQGDERIPHMGWDQVKAGRPSALLRNTGETPYLYFAHSYYCPVIPETSATCDYIVPYTAVLEHRNICGVQFHPEKSGALGLRVVQNFVES
jgi:imidazole glycerol phosphate synthase glutamine amidotransferase subunit